MCLYLTKRGSTYYFRRVIPPELRSILGQREYTFSLGTKDKDEAKRLRSEHAVRTDRLIDEAHARLSHSRPSKAAPSGLAPISEEQLELEQLAGHDEAEREARREELSDYIAFLTDATGASWTARLSDDEEERIALLDADVVNSESDAATVCDIIVVDGPRTDTVNDCTTYGI